MKTNQLMQVRIGDYVQPINHKSMMGNLNTLWDFGNSLRELKGKMPLQLKDFLASPDTVEYMIALERKVNGGNPDIIKIEYDGHGRCKKVAGEWTVLETKRGKNGGTWAHLYLMLKAATHLDKEFELDVYHTFVTSKILQWRDDSGTEYNILKDAIDLYLPKREGKDNLGVYIQTAKRIKSKINPDGDEWNTATYEQLEKRTMIEKSLVQFLYLGMIKDFDHLKEILEKL